MRPFVAVLALFLAGARAVAHNGARHQTRSFNTTSTCEQIAKAVSSASDVWWPRKFYMRTPQSCLTEICYSVVSLCQGCLALGFFKFRSSCLRSGAGVSSGRWYNRTPHTSLECRTSICSFNDVFVSFKSLVLTKRRLPSVIVHSAQTHLAKINTSLQVKGGGHASNPGFSSTSGVQIAMFRFSEVNYDATSQTVDVGAGLVWDDVYATLEPQGVNVVGGRVTGVGVAGFTLGGGLWSSRYNVWRWDELMCGSLAGYSWLTNQHGLTVDTIVAFELVLPDGTVTEVTQTSNPDLFFALKVRSDTFHHYDVVT